MFWTVACFSLPVPWPSVWETSKTLILVTKSFERFDGKVITKHIIETAIIGKNSLRTRKVINLEFWFHGPRLLSMKFGLEPAWDELRPFQCSLCRPAQLKISTTLK